MANGNGNGNGRGNLYLNLIMTLCAVLLGLLAWVMNSSVNRNDLDHMQIKQVQATKADRKDIDKIERSIEKLVDRITLFIDESPRPHIHTDRNGSITKVVPSD